MHGGNMASKQPNKKRPNKKKTDNKNITIVAIIVIVVLVVAIAAVAIWLATTPKGREVVNNVWQQIIAALQADEDKHTAKDVDAQTGNVVLEEGDLSFHFLTLGNRFTGDSTYVKIGDVDILIDAGSRQNSGETIVNYVRKYCTDGKLEYVIATHAHQDHIAGFVGLSGKENPLTAFDVGTIIDFSRTNYTEESDLYMKYCAARDAAVSEGAKHYTALECWNNQNGAQRSYTLSDGVTMDILYNYYYENSTSDENNYSVCVMFNSGEDH